MIFKMRRGSHAKKHDCGAGCRSSLVFVFSFDIASASPLGLCSGLQVGQAQQINPNS